MQTSLGNLATHMCDKHLNVGSELPVDNGIGATGMSWGVSAESAKIMDDFLKDGILNPAACSCTHAERISPCFCSFNT
jgi:hypothetical protein